MKKKLIFFGIIICIIIGYIFIKVSNNLEPSRSIESKVKSTIFQMRDQAEIIYQRSFSGSFENLCSDYETKSLLSNIKKSTIKCFSDSDSWVVAVNVNVKKTNTYYCSDSNVSEEINETQYNTIINADTLCLGSSKVNNNSALDIKLIKENTLACNKEIIPELKKFESEYLGGGNMGTVEPDRIFFGCLDKKMIVTQEIKDYIYQNSESITPPFLD
jgi:hypothetical protein